ncbi:MAG: 50S ribosomal protein L24 [Ardenticatenales bacterium]
MNRVRKGDLVEVISGDDNGARGEVQSVLLAKGRVVIRGVNMVKKHQRRTGGIRTQTGIIEFEAPISLSNVMPVCGSCDKPVRVGFAAGAEGRKVRMCRACGAIID